MGKDAASPPSAAPEEASSSDRGGEFVRRPLGSLESEGENLAAQTEESVEALASSLVLQDSRAASPHKTAAASQRVFTPTGSSPSLRGGAAGSGSSLKKHTHSPPPASLSALSALGGGGGSAGGVSFASVVERHQQSLGHAHPSSSRAATEGSPPSSPRSTFSSIISFQDAAFSAALNASGRGGNLELLSADAEEDGSLIAGCGADARAPLGGCLRNAVVSNVLSDSIVATACGADSLPADGEYQVSVSVPDLKFSCSHFVAYKGFRERMHGHNYTVAVAVGGELGGDGFVLDFSDLKKVVRAVCKVCKTRPSPALLRRPSGESQMTLQTVQHCAVSAVH